MKSLTSKFVLALLSLVLTGAALSVGVYAWFTINNRVSIDAFSGQVEGGEGLLLSVDGGANWSGFIPTNEIQAVIANNGFLKFGEMTSQNGYRFYQLDGTTEVTGSSGYISFDVWFLGTSNIEQINVNQVTFTSPGATEFPSEIETSVTLENHAANAARLSIVELATDGTIPSSSVNAVAFEQADTVDGNTLGKGTWADPNNSYDNTGNYAVWYYNRVRQINTSLPEITQTMFDGADLIDTVDRNPSGSIPATMVADNAETIASPITGQENFTKQFKVRVFVWIEGWDQEAYNAILSGQLSVSLAFEGVTA